MDEELFEQAQAYASTRGLVIADRLGFGIHGTVFSLKSQTQPGEIALKVHSSAAPYFREVGAYERLRDAGVSRIRGAFRVPQLLRRADDFLAFEMTIVAPPFVLDFAGAYLDRPPQFSPEVWEEWEREKREQFGANWPAVQAVLNELRDELGIFLLDIHPSNIAFPRKMHDH